jgi:NADH:ubiquinone oxidoreductase subunit 4 (subunit M)
VHDVSKQEALVLGVLCAMIALFGIMPWLIMDVIDTMFVLGGAFL